MTLPDAGIELERALAVQFVNFAGTVGIELASRPWASITFSGARHRLVLRIAGAGAAAAADAFLDGLEGREFALRGHILADIVVVREVREPGGVRLTLEALTVESG